MEALGYVDDMGMVFLDLTAAAVEVVPFRKNKLRDMGVAIKYAKTVTVALLATPSASGDGNSPDGRRYRINAELSGGCRSPGWIGRLCRGSCARGGHLRRAGKTWPSTNTHADKQSAMLVVTKAITVNTAYVKRGVDARLLRPHARGWTTPVVHAKRIPELPQAEEAPFAKMAAKTSGLR